MSRATASWVDRVWLLLTCAMSFAVAVLNFHATHDFHTIEKHLVFRERILQGFTTEILPSYPIPPTFPMWGYGFVLLLTTNKVLLIALQIVVAIWSAWYLIRVLEDSGVLKPSSIVAFRLLLLVCIPWYAYHSIEWSQSLATSCLIFCIALLGRAVHSRPVSWRLLACSGLCLGLNLNFASDLYLLPLALAATYWMVAGRSRLAAAQAAVWLGAVVLSLTPWMIYTWRATGTPLMKSTNQGHVLLIGLGQDPRRRFGITYSDNDPTMYRIIEEDLGADFAHRFYASCSFEADRVLRPAFVRIVASQPWAYADLVVYRLRLILTGNAGTYTGEFDEGENAHSFGIALSSRHLLHRMAGRIGFLLHVGTTVLGPLVAWLAIRQREPVWAFVLMTIAYQYVSLSIAVLQPQYISNLILLQLTVIAAAPGAVFSTIAAKANNTVETS